MSEVWTTLRVLDWTAARFDRASIESPRLEAQILLAHVLSCDRVSLYTAFERPLLANELSAFRALIKRRLAGESVAYLTGVKEFWSREFTVDSRVLVPRADSETLISLVLDNVASCPDGPICDLGTGSGALAVTLACELPRRRVIAIDVSQDALDVARQNAERHEASDRIDFRRGDLLTPLEVGEVAILVANLPYVESAEIDSLAPEVRCEPRLALDGGADGLDLVRRLVAGMAAHLCAGALVALEHGDDQGRAVRELLMGLDAMKSVETTADLGGQQRVTSARYRPA